APLEKHTGDALDAMLLRAARAFVVKRDDAVSVIAGYPWFLDWGRDSLICARGLLAGGMVVEVQKLLSAFARFEQNGTLPHTTQWEEASNRASSDAPLWFGKVCEELAGIVGPEIYSELIPGTRRTLLEVLESIAVHYGKGTPNRIKMDPQTALIWSPSHFT